MMAMQDAVLPGEARRVAAVYGAAFGAMFVVGMAALYMEPRMQVVWTVAMLGSALGAGWSFIRVVRSGFRTAGSGVDWPRLSTLGFGYGGLIGLVIGSVYGLVLLALVVKSGLKVLAVTWPAVTGVIWYVAMATYGALGVAVAACAIGAFAGLAAALGFGLLFGQAGWWQGLAGRAPILVAATTGAALDFVVGWGTLQALGLLLGRLLAFD